MTRFSALEIESVSSNGSSSDSDSSSDSSTDSSTDSSNCSNSSKVSSTSNLSLESVDLSDPPAYEFQETQKSRPLYRPTTTHTNNTNNNDNTNNTNNTNNTDNTKKIKKKNKNQYPNQDLSSLTAKINMHMIKEIYFICSNLGFANADPTNFSFKQNLEWFRDLKQMQLDRGYNLFCFKARNDPTICKQDFSLDAVYVFYNQLTRNYLSKYFTF